MTKKKTVSIAKKKASPDKHLKAEAGRHERFCHEYIIDYNGAQAYIRAGYDVKDANVAKACASRLLTDANVKARIAELEREMLDALRIGPARVLREQARIAFSDPADIVADDGTIKQLKDMDPGTRAAISSIEVFEEYSGTGKERVLIGFTKKVKLWDKNHASTNLMKHKGLFEQDNNQLGRAIARAIIVPAKAPAGSGGT